MKNFNFLIIIFLITASFSATMAQSPWILQYADGLHQSADPQLALSAVDKNTCWGCSAYSQFVRTTDGGSTWIVGTIDTGQCACISAVDSSTAWIAVVNPSGILQTTDGGLTWTKNTDIYQEIDSYPFSVHFFDANHGVCVGGPSRGNWEIYTTSNGGTDWNRVPSGNIPKPLTGELQLFINGSPPIPATAAENSLWFSTRQGSLYRTTDQGMTWTVTRHVMDNNSFSPFFAAFKDSLNGLACAFIYGNKISRTTDGGVTWNLVPLPSPLSEFTLWFLAYEKGTNGTYFLTGIENNRETTHTIPGTALTTDNGATWVKINSLPVGPMDFASDGVGWGGGVNDSVYKWTGLSIKAAVDTGFWHVELLLQDGSLFHQGIQQYHSDGLEMEDAAAPAVNPANFCMGIWKQSGDTVQIYHIVFMYNGIDTLPPVSYGEITETNILSSDGNSFNGTFEVKVYDLNNGDLLADVNGTTKASRIDFDHPFSLFSTATGLGSRMFIPTNYALSQNYPNPFNPTTTINYTIPKAEHVTIKVFDISGKVVQTLVDRQLSAGTYHARFNGSNISSGVYFYQIKTDNFVEAKKMIFLK